MSKVIFKLKFQSPNFKSTKMNNMYHLLYIGTREGVALNNDIKELENVKSTNDEYLKYISDRPRSHGLFNKNGNVGDIREVANYMKEYEGYVYRGIISLRENEAIEKGFDEKENWENLIRDKMLYMSKQLNIPYSKLEWVGAFHRESGHPHVHVMMWDKSNSVRNIGIIPKKNIENIRKELTKGIYENEVEKVLSLKNLYRNSIISNTRDFTKTDYSNELKVLDNKVKMVNLKFDVKNYEDKLSILSKKLEKSEKPEEIKKEIEDITSKLEKSKSELGEYETKDKIENLKVQKEIETLKKKLDEVKKDKGIYKYEEYLQELSLRNGLKSNEKKIRTCKNQRNLLDIKSEMFNLNKNKELISIENEFKAKGIDIKDIINNQQDNLHLDEKQLLLKERYESLTSEIKERLDNDIETIDLKLEQLQEKYKANEWQLNKLVKDDIISSAEINESDIKFIREYLDVTQNKLEDNKENIKNKELESIGELLEYRINNLTDSINTNKLVSNGIGDLSTINNISEMVKDNLVNVSSKIEKIDLEQTSLEEINKFINDESEKLKSNIKNDFNISKKVFDELNILIDSDIDNFKIDIEMKKEFNSYKNIEKKMNMEKIKGNVFDLESDLKSLMRNTKEFKSEKALELEERLKNITKEYTSTNSDEIKEKLNNQIKEIKTLLKEEFKDVESKIDLEIDDLKSKLKNANIELSALDEDFNEFNLGERIRNKTLDKIGSMIKDLEVPKSGRLQYKLMPPEVKEKIDNITNEMLNLPQYSKLMEHYLKSVEDLTKLYTDKPEDIERARENAKEDIYIRIGNNILKAKKDMLIEYDNKTIYQTDFAVQKLLNNITKLFTSKTNQNNKTRLISNDRSKAEIKKNIQENKAKGLYSEYDLE